MVTLDSADADRACIRSCTLSHTEEKGQDIEAQLFADNKLMNSLVPDYSSPSFASSVPSGPLERQVPSSRDLSTVMPNIKGTNKDDTQTNT